MDEQQDAQNEKLETDASQTSEEPTTTSSFLESLQAVLQHIRKFLGQVVRNIRNEIVEDATRLVAFAIIALVAFLLTRVDWTGLFSRVRAQTIVLQKDPYHIGDVEYKVILDADGEVIDVIPYDHPAPQANPFRVEFELKGVPRKAVLYVTARDVDPDENSSPVEIRINDLFVTYLNRKFGQETMVPKTVSIEIEPDCFQIGKNRLSIYVQPTKLEYGLLNLDDIEFRDVKLEIE